MRKRRRGKRGAVLPALLAALCLGTGVLCERRSTADGSAPKARPAEADLAATEILLDVPCLAQNPEFPTGCESVSAAMLCGAYGLAFDTDRFVDAFLPRAETPHGENGVTVGGDMRTAFLGDPRSETGWGCYATALAPALSDYLKGSGYRAEVLQGETMADLLRETVAAGEPALIWVTIGMAPAQTTARWTVPETGETLEWIYPMHCAVLSGYGGDALFLNDPMTGEVTPYPRSSVEAAYDALGRQAVVLLPED